MVLQVPGSVLWLLTSSNAQRASTFAANVKREAAAAGVHPSRLSIAPLYVLHKFPRGCLCLISHAPLMATSTTKLEHLKRHGLADVFLDTIVVSLQQGAHPL